MDFCKSKKLFTCVNIAGCILRIFINEYSELFNQLYLNLAISETVEKEGIAEKQITRVCRQFVCHASN